MNEEMILSIVTLTAVILGIIVNFTSLRNRRDEQVKADTVRDTKLDSILSTVNRLTADQANIETVLRKHSDRILIAEQTGKAVEAKLKELCDDAKRGAH